MLLFWPCAWGLTLAYNFSTDIKKYFIYLILFFLGAVLMRSAGCIVNDILDRKFDKKVFRTKNRPIASKKISVALALFYSAILCLAALLVLINFNYFTIILALASMPLAFSYPLMKRYTYWPQLFLGITFNYGLILGWTSITNEISLIPIILYLGSIFWTLGYDTIYGFQDINDDEIIGLKSTSIKFKKNPLIFLNFSYVMFVISIFLIGILAELNYLSLIFFILTIYNLYYIQLANLNVKSPKICFKIFKSNNLLGFIVYLGLLVGKI
jgi:4-hydroxybenzoate polyprenyltransferase